MGIPCVRQVVLIDACSGRVEPGSTGCTNREALATPLKPPVAQGLTPQVPLAALVATRESLSAGPGSTVYRNMANPLQG